MAEREIITIDEEKCTKCGLCIERCRFGALTNDLKISPIVCEGCGVCTFVCPSNSVKLTERSWVV